MKTLKGVYCQRHSSRSLLSGEDTKRGLLSQEQERKQQTTECILDSVHESVGENVTIEKDLHGFCSSSLGS